ncbi:MULTISPECIES: hypothetical protein [unclassified Aureispira]|uniref:hypothetical protein n=1 Tax=unclassified Aureispira TaxID=2649989 RepID=UPI000AB4CC19|nr:MULTISPECIES: hypothetical protein [unclassified Aureispira]WMX14702.1 hypothetical protein QP953_27985 [Aureispira sp. CCB-E]
MAKFDGIDIIEDELYDDSQEGDAIWLNTRFEIKTMLGLNKLPDLQGILFAIGLQELGQIRDEFTKEERQDLMHIAVCRLLSYDGYYELEGYDEDGWPHWKQMAIPPAGRAQQEVLLRRKIAEYIEHVKNS